MLADSSGGGVESVAAILSGASAASVCGNLILCTNCGLLTIFNIPKVFQLLKEELKV